MEDTPRACGRCLSERISPPVYSWVSLIGPFEMRRDEIIFPGYSFPPPSPKAEGQEAVALSQPEPRGGVGRLVSNQRLTDA